MVSFREGKKPFYVHIVLVIGTACPPDDDDTSGGELRPGYVHECLACSSLVYLGQLLSSDGLRERGAGGVTRHQIYLGHTSSTGQRGPAGAGEVTHCGAGLDNLTTRGGVDDLPKLTFDSSSMRTSWKMIVALFRESPAPSLVMEKDNVLMTSYLTSSSVQLSSPVSRNSPSIMISPSKSSLILRSVVVELSKSWSRSSSPSKTYFNISGEISSTSDDSILFFTNPRISEAMV